MNWHKLLISSTIYGLLILEGNLAKTVKKRGVMDNFSDGIKAAGQMFGINTVADVANLVARAFSNNNNSERNKSDLFAQSTEHYKGNPETTNQHKEDEKTGKQFHSRPSSGLPSKETAGLNLGTSNLIASMLRLVGLDASKLGALAINALVMIASAIGNTLMGTTNAPTLRKTYHSEEENTETGPEEKYSPNEHQPRSQHHDATSIEWFLQNSSGKMKRILKQATDTDLADKLIDMIANYETQQGQASCIKMLVCKSSPFIWGMQRSIRQHIDGKVNNETANAPEEDFKAGTTSQRLFDVQSFFTHLPSTEEYREYSEKCEQIYSAECNTTEFFDKKH